MAIYGTILNARCEILDTIPLNNAKLGIASRKRFF